MCGVVFMVSVSYKVANVGCFCQFSLCCFTDDATVADANQLSEIQSIVAPCGLRGCKNRAHSIS